MSEENVLVPDLGGAEEVDVIEVCVRPGDSIQQEDPMIVVESDKATVEVPAPFAGTVKQVKTEVGSKVSEGDLILVVDTEASQDESPQAPAEEPSAPAEPQAPAEANAPEPPASAAAGGGAEEQVTVPDIGGSEDVDVIEVSVTEGDAIEQEQTLIVLESDKATIEVPSPVAGTVKKLLVKQGDKVSQGTPILMAEVAQKTAEPEQGQPEQAQQPAPAPSEPKTPAPAAAPQPQSPSQSQPQPSQGALAANLSADVHAGPAVRRLANELGVDLSKVQGSGPKGRILKDDVHRFVKEQLTQPAPASTGVGLPQLPEIDFSKFGEIETESLSKIRKVSAANLHRSWLTIPHVTQHDQADITDLEAFRKSQSAAYKEQGVKLTLLAFMVKAVVHALKEFPRFNASLDATGENLIYKKYFHIGVAVDTPNGLVVPVIKDADQQSVVEIAESLRVLSEKARDKKLSPAEMQGGCFSISSLGGIGGTAFTPVVNWPEVAILGVSRMSTQPVYQNGEFVPRLMLPLSLSYDHRVIDGADAARFTSYLSDLLGDVRKMVL